MQYRLFEPIIITLLLLFLKASRKYKIKTLLNSVWLLYLEPEKCMQNCKKENRILKTN